MNLIEQEIKQRKKIERENYINDLPKMERPKIKKVKPLKSMFNKKKYYSELYRGI